VKNVIYKGISSIDLGLRIVDWERPLLPEIRDHIEYIPGREGVVHFPQPFGTRTITVCFRFFASNTDRMGKITNISQWLYSTEFSRLEFDDEPDVYYLAKPLEPPKVDPGSIINEFEVVFVCQPFKFGEEQEEVFSDIGAGEPVTFTNNGTVESYPEIEIILAQSLESDLNIMLNSETLTFTPSEEIASGSVISNNSDDYSFRVDDQPIILELSGDFPVVRAGENTLIVSAATQHIVVRWQPRFV
jgi:predicted phage tail component-like protein